MPSQNLPGPILDRTHPLSCGLVGWWPMNEGGGERLNDISPYQNRGILTNVVQSTIAGWTGGNGAITRGVLFDYAASAHAVIPDAPQLRLLGSMTVSFWIRPKDRSNYYMPLGKSTSDIANPFVVMHFLTSGLIYFSRGDGATETQLVSATAPTVGVWTHVCIVCNGTVDTTFYFNGKVDVVRAGFSNSITDGGSPLYLARRGSGYYFPGGLAHVRLYNRALGGREVMQLYTDPLAGALAPVRASRYYSVPPAAVPAAIAAPPTADRLWNRGYVGRIFRRGEKG